MKISPDGLNSTLETAEGRISALKEMPIETIQSETWIQTEKVGGKGTEP